MNKQDQDGLGHPRVLQGGRPRGLDIDGLVERVHEQRDRLRVVRVAPAPRRTARSRPAAPRSARPWPAPVCAVAVVHPQQHVLAELLADGRLRLRVQEGGPEVRRADRVGLLQHERPARVEPVRRHAHRDRQQEREQGQQRPREHLVGAFLDVGRAFLPVAADAEPDLERREGDHGEQQEDPDDRDRVDRAGRSRPAAGPWRSPGPAPDRGPVPEVAEHVGREDLRVDRGVGREPAAERPMAPRPGARPWPRSRRGQRQVGRGEPRIERAAAEQPQRAGPRGAPRCRATNRWASFRHCAA